MDAFADQTDEERPPFPTASMNKQAKMLDDLGERGWDVYEMKFDSDGHALYFGWLR
jgi:hypothetical protein